MRVLITGASRGIGRSIAEALGRAGHTVFGTSRSGRIHGDLSRRVIPVSLDLADHASIRDCVRKVLPVHVLINNAGVSQFGCVEETPIEVLRRVFEVNLFGAVKLSQAVLPAMRADGRGLIVNVGSLASAFPLPVQAAYSASKAALDAFTVSLRAEVRDFGIRVVCVQPGHVNTGMVAEKHGSEGSDYQGLTSRWGALRDRSLARAPGPEIVVPTMLRVLESVRPRTFHPVGRYARFVMLLRRLLPQSVVEWLVRRPATRRPAPPAAA
jgi:NAD(P)-dependent dehydrogenase (short-subunit alcohol dehydrogenase family)